MCFCAAFCGVLKIDRLIDYVLLGGVWYTEPTAQFTVPLKEVQSVEGQTVEMSCELSKPDQKVTWLKDGVELKPDDHCDVVVDGCVHRLTIHNATLEDEAEYTVKLTDDVTTKATLWVEGTM